MRPTDEKRRPKDFLPLFFLGVLLLLSFQLPIDGFFILVLLAGIWYGQTIGGLVGLLSGLGLDAFVGVLGVHLVSRTVLGFLSGTFRRSVLSLSPWVYGLWVVLAYGVMMMVEGGSFFFRTGQVSNFWSLFRWESAPVWTLLAAGLFYPIVKKRFQ